MADRRKKLSQKELAQAATKPGQTKLESFFVCVPISPATDSASHDSAQITSSKEVEYFKNVGMEESLTYQYQYQYLLFLLRHKKNRKK